MALKSLLLFNFIILTTFSSWGMEEAALNKLIHKQAIRLAMKCDREFDRTQDDAYETIDTYYQATKSDKFDLFRDGWHQIKWDIFGTPHYTQCFESETEALSKKFNHWRSLDETIEHALRYRAIWNIPGLENWGFISGVPNMNSYNCAAVEKKVKEIIDNPKNCFTNNLAFNGWTKTILGIACIAGGIYGLKTLNPERVIAKIVKFTTFSGAFILGLRFFESARHDLSDRYLYFDELKTLQSNKLRAIKLIMARGM